MAVYERGARAAAPYAFTATKGLVMAAGGVAGGYIRKMLKRNRYYAEYIETNMKEWSPLATALVVAVVYSLARERILGYLGQYGEWLDDIIIGIVAGFAARQGGIFAGDTEIFASGKMKIIAKNVGTISKVIVDGTDVTQNVSINGEEVDLSNAGIAAGVHKVLVIGSDRGAYEELYIPG